MKYLTYIFRNARRNPVRSILTIASMAICLFLTMTLLSFFAIYDELDERNANLQPRDDPQLQRLRRLGADFAGQGNRPSVEGVMAATPFSWFGGKYQDEVMPFAQFGVDADVVFDVLDEFTLPADQLKSFKENKDSCVIGRKLAVDRKLNVGDALPLKGDAYFRST